jgi:hypothetical protein
MASEDLSAASPMNDASQTPTRKSLWMRGLYMLITAFLIGAAQSVLFLLAVIQFILMLVGGNKANAQIANVGDMLGKWLLTAAKFQTAQSDEKPWPMGPAS